LCLGRYLIDNKLGIVVEAEGNRANRIDENQACVDRVARVAKRFGIEPRRLGRRAAAYSR